MKRIIQLTTLVLLVCAAPRAEAQFFKKLQKRIEDKVEKRLERKADQKADQALDSVFENKSVTKKRRKKARGKEEEQSQETKGGFNLGGMMDAMMNQEPAVYEDSYSFFITTKMKVSTNGKNTMVMTTSYGEGAQLIKMDKGMTIINDLKNGAMITLNEEDKSGQVINTKMMEMLQNMGGDREEDIDGEVTITPTGKTKTINGYRCKNYLVTSEEMDMDIWATDDINFNMKQYAKKMAELFQTPSSEAMIKSDIGFPMQMISKVNRDTVEMTILEVNENPSSINLSNYNLQKL